MFERMHPRNSPRFRQFWNLRYIQPIVVVPRVNECKEVFVLSGEYDIYYRVIQENGVVKCGMITMEGFLNNNDFGMVKVESYNFIDKEHPRNKGIIITRIDQKSQ